LMTATWASKFQIIQPVEQLSLEGWFDEITQLLTGKIKLLIPVAPCCQGFKVLISRKEVLLEQI
jgi:hypothetical protein